MPDFNQQKDLQLAGPGSDARKITDPKNVGADSIYPKHLFAPCEAEEEGAHVVAWQGKTPVYNVFINVANEEAEAAAVEAGWAVKPVVPAPPKAAVRKVPVTTASGAPAPPAPPKGEKAKADKPKGEKAKADDKAGE